MPQKHEWSVAEKVSERLAKDTFSIFKKGKKLIVFPLIGAIVALAGSTILSLVGYIILSKRQDVFATSFWIEVLQFSPRDYDFGLLLFAVYVFVVFLVAIYLEGALILCAYQFLRGEKISVKKGIVGVARNILNITAWAAMYTLIAVIARLIGKRLRSVSKTAEDAGSFWMLFPLIGWTIATYFVIPLLVIERVNVATAVKRSAFLVKKVWRKNVLSGIKVFASFAVYYLIVWGVVIALVAMLPLPLEIAIVLLIAALTITAIISIFRSAVYGVLYTVLYMYATTGKIAPGFSEHALKNAFVEKKERLR